MQRRKVDLPEPDGPSRHIDLAAADRQVDPLQDLVAAEALVDAARR